MKNIKFIFDRVFIFRPWMWVFLILLISFILRIPFIDYPLINGEVNRDYLTGIHIVKYHEIPLIGPIQGATGDVIKNSPIYYYIIASFILIKDNTIFLVIANIFSQIIVIFAIYLLAKKLFSHKTGLIAATLYSMSYVSLNQSKHFWQPYEMAPIAYLSYLLLLMAYLRKNQNMLFLSIFLFLLAGAIHNSVYGLIPSFIALTVFILHKLKASIAAYIYAEIIAFYAILIFYAPYGIYFFKNRNEVDRVFGFLEGKIARASTVDFFPNLSANVTLLLKSFFFESWNIITIGFILGIFFYWKIQKDAQKKFFFLISLVIIIQFFIITSFIGFKFFDFYLIPISGVFIILLAEIIEFVFSKFKFLQIYKYLLIICLMFIVSRNLTAFNKEIPFKRYNLTLSAARSIKREIVAIKAKERKKTNNFFVIKTYALGVSNPSMVDLPFWALIEQEMNERFITLNNDRVYDVLNDAQYIFVICQSYPAKINIHIYCKDRFLKNYESYEIKKEIYRANLLTIFVAKRVDNSIVQKIKE